MTSILFVAVALALVSFSSAEDDGKYRPEKYGGDDGRYRHYDDGRYYASQFGDYYGRNGKYDSIYTAYQPAYIGAYSPYQQLIAPVVTYNGDNSIEYQPLASAVSAVRYQPVTVRPVPAAVQPAYYARQYTTDQYAKIVRQDQDQDVNAYHYLYQTDNGIAAEETGRVDTPGGNGGTRVNGFYEYVGDDGQKYRVDYVADENGFQPRGAHLPQNKK